MRRRDWDYLIIATMLVSGLYVTVSGVVAGIFGFPQFAWHAYAGYLCAILVGVHLILNGSRIMTYVRQRWHPFGARRPTESLAVSRADVAPVAVRHLISPARRQWLVSGLTATGGFLIGRIFPRRQAELPYAAADIGELYHQWSKPGYEGIVGLFSDWGGQPARYKTYPAVERVTLPPPSFVGGMSFAEALTRRRSVRSYVAAPLSPAELADLLYAAQGVTDTQRALRAAPSAGALYPIEVYVVVNNVTDLAPGLYHYAVREHALELLKQEDLRLAVSGAGLGQGFLGQANVCFILSAIFQRTRWRYRERTYRYVLFEAGHIAQNLYLAATALGMGACAVGAFLDDEFNALVGLDGKSEAVLYVIAAGKTRD